MAIPRSTWRWAVVAHAAAVLLLCAAMGGADAAHQPRRKRRRKSVDGQSMQTYFSALKWLYAAIIIPLFLFLLYAVLRDPVTPHILKELWYRAQEAVTGQKIVLDGDAPTSAETRPARGVNHAHQA